MEKEDEGRCPTMEEGVPKRQSFSSPFFHPVRLPPPPPGEQTFSETELQERMTESRRGEGEGRAKEIHTKACMIS